MKKAICLLLAVVLCLSMAACGSPKDYVLTEDTFFLVMTNMQYYPEQYIGSNLELDVFTYLLEDVNGQQYLCGVRKCSAEFGCVCGNDTVIGFILNSDEELPAPRNQSENSVEKTWVHLKGQLASAEKQDIEIHSYLPDGSIDPNKTETVSFLHFNVASCDLIEDYQNLQYYVTK